MAQEKSHGTNPPSPARPSNVRPNTPVDEKPITTIRVKELLSARDTLRHKCYFLHSKFTFPGRQIPCYRRKVCLLICLWILPKSRFPFRKMTPSMAKAVRIPALPAHPPAGPHLELVSSRGRCTPPLTDLPRFRCASTERVPGIAARPLLTSLKANLFMKSELRRLVPSPVLSCSCPEIRYTHSFISLCCKLLFHLLQSINLEVTSGRSCCV